MVYEDRYQYYLEQIPTDIERCIRSGKRHVFGYTSNLDVIVEWNTEIFNNILSKFLRESPSAKEGETIDSMEDFARIVSYYAIKGLGGEVDITNYKVCKYLEENFKTQFSLGGTCAQGAAAINAVGFPVLAHLTDKSKEVCDIVNHSDFFIVNNKEAIPVNQIEYGDIPIKHLIIQYSKGDKVLVNNIEYPIPISNRIIADYDMVHKRLPIEKSFLEYCEKNASKIYSYDISGFNGITDLEILEQRLSELKEHYQKIKRGNPQCILYLESAHFLSTKSKLIVFNALSPYLDILGMNEEELVDLTRQIGIEVNKDDLLSVLAGLDGVAKHYGTNIIMHTKDYALFYGDEIEGVNIEKGLTLGNLMSGTRARTGRYGSYKDCFESLTMQISQTGLEFAEKLSRMSFTKDVCLVPSRYMEQPKCTIGLGDTFVAGVQICFTN